MENSSSNKGANKKETSKVFALDGGERLQRKMIPGFIQFGKYFAIAVSGIVLLLIAMVYLEQNERYGIILLAIFLILMGAVRFYTTYNSIHYVTDRRIVKVVAGGVWHDIPIKEIREVSFKKAPWGHRVLLFVIAKGCLFRVNLNDLKPEDAIWLKKWLQKHKDRPKEIRG